MAPVEYSVSVPDPDERLLRVRVDVPRVDAQVLTMKMPVWTPGSYLIREYPRHVQDLRARAPEGRRLDVEKSDKATWRVDCPETDRVVVSYAVYAHDLNVREKHVDDAHAFYNPTAVYLRPHGRRGEPAELTIADVPEGWDIHCPLPESEETGRRWRADDVGALYDAPVEMGDHDQMAFRAGGATHRMVFRGEGEWDRGRLERDLPAIVEANADVFGGGLPYDDYLFITLLSEDDYGGLEHRNSTALIYPRDQFGAPDSAAEEPPIEDEEYLDFLSLVAHEHFHAWNVKRLFPAPLERPNHQREEYVRQLWTIEGVTSYYDRLALLRSGRIDARGFLEMMADRMARYDRTPGRHRDSLEEAGFDAWIKHYRRDEHTDNLTVSYYLKGALVAMLLDLRIRDASGGEFSLDDLMRRLWSEFGPPDTAGFPPGTYRRFASELAGTDLDGFFEELVAGTGDIDWSRHLDAVGLELDRSAEADTPSGWLGVRTEWRGRELAVTAVPENGPAHRAGVHPGDELVALGGRKLSRDRDLEDRLARVDPGASVDLHLFRRGQLMTRTADVGQRPPNDYGLAPTGDCSNDQLARRRGWLGTVDLE